jgi:hypothetical protein
MVTSCCPPDDTKLVIDDVVQSATESGQPLPITAGTGGDTIGTGRQLRAD